MRKQINVITLMEDGWSQNPLGIQSYNLSVPFLVDEVVIERTNVVDPWQDDQSLYLMCSTNLIPNEEFLVDYEAAYWNTQSVPKPFVYLFPEKKDINGLYDFTLYDSFNKIPVTHLRLSIVISFTSHL